MLTPKQRRWLPALTAVALLAVPSTAGAVQAAADVPEGAVYVAPDGDAGNSGSSPSAPRPVETAVQAAGTDATIVFLGGTYRGVSLTVDTRLTLMANPGDQVMVKGSEEVTGWSKEGAVWVADLPAAKEPAPSRRLLFLDDKALEAVEGPEDVVPGTFFADTAAGRVILADDPEGGTVEVVVAEHAFRFTGAGRTSTVDGLVFRHYAGAPLAGLTEPVPPDDPGGPTPTTRPAPRPATPAPGAQPAGGRPAGGRPAGGHGPGGPATGDTLAAAAIGASLPTMPAATPAAESFPQPGPDGGDAIALPDEPAEVTPSTSASGPLPLGPAKGLVENASRGLRDRGLGWLSRTLPGLALLEVLVLGGLLLARARRRRRTPDRPGPPLALPAPAAAPPDTAAPDTAAVGTPVPAVTVRVRAHAMPSGRGWTSPSRASRTPSVPARPAASPLPRREGTSAVPPTPVAEAVGGPVAEAVGGPVAEAVGGPVAEAVGAPTGTGHAEPPGAPGGAGPAGAGPAGAVGAPGTGARSPAPGGTVAVTDREGSIARLEEWIELLADEQAPRPGPRRFTRLFRGSQRRT
jgi:hypothetical protein